MKIEQSCAGETGPKFSTVAVGTVFYYGSRFSGPYLKVSNSEDDGYWAVSLKSNAAFKIRPDFILENYKVMPNARIVLE